MRIKSLGVDLSLTGTGIALLEDEKLVYSGTIKSKKEGDTPTTEVLRINTIVGSVMEHVTEDVDIVVLEGIAFMAKSTALAQLSGLTYLVRSKLVERGVPFLVVAPTSLKKFVTGKGNSPKDVMMLETFKRFGVSIPENNQCDAYGLAQVGLATLDPKYKSTEFQKEVIKLIKKQI